MGLEVFGIEKHWAWTGNIVLGHDGVWHDFVCILICFDVTHQEVPKLVLVAEKSISNCLI